MGMTCNVMAQYPRYSRFLVERMDFLDTDEYTRSSWVLWILLILSGHGSFPGQVYRASLV